MSSSWPKAWAVSAIGSAGWRLSAASAVKAKECACLVAGLDDAVGEQDELLAAGLAEDGFRVGSFGGQAERQAVFEGDSLPSTDKERGGRRWRW